MVLRGPADATGLKGPGVLTVAPLTQLFMGTPEPRVTLEVKGKPVNLLLDTGATLAVLLSNPGTPSTLWVAVRGVAGKPTTNSLLSLSAVCGETSGSLCPS